MKTETKKILPFGIFIYWCWLLAFYEGIAGYKTESTVFYFLGVISTAILSTIYYKMFGKYYAVIMWISVIISVQKYFF